MRYVYQIADNQVLEAETTETGMALASGNLSDLILMDIQLR